MKVFIPPFLAILFLHLAKAEEDVAPINDGFGFFAHELVRLRHWTLGLTSYSGSRVPSVRNADGSMNEEYGVQIGAHWALPGRVRLGLEIPYALERFSPWGAGTDSHVDAGSSYPEPRVAGMLTLSAHF